MASSSLQSHREEHYRCEQLGEGACVPVVCSCGERWVGAHEFHGVFRPDFGDCADCDAEVVPVT